MKKLFTLFILIVISVSVFSQTPVSGDQSGTWASTNSPYQVIGEIIVPAGQTLTIEAGIEVNFQAHYKFTVKGNLQALGTVTDSIFFTTDNQATGWGGIRFESSNGISNFSFCRIEYGKTAGEYPDNHGGAIALVGSDAVFSNCVFADNEAVANDSGMGGAVYASGTGGTAGPLTLFTECLFLRNHAYGEGGAIKFTGDYNTEIISCEFYSNNCLYGGGAISFYLVTGTKLIYSVFSDNYTMYSNGGAFNTLGMGNTISARNCTISGNSAVTGDGGAVNIAYGTADFTNCIVYDNPGMYSDDVNLDYGGYAEINYCNLTMPNGATGNNNINENPQFVNAANLDFHLMETSPCIDAGDPSSPLDPDGTIADMGAFYFDQSQASQQITLSLGYSFMSSHIIPENPDMLAVMASVLTENLDYIRNSQGEVLRKIGPNWINNIGDWVIDEGYLVKMFADDSFNIEGNVINPATPISVEAGFQFVSYFPETSMDALIAFETIIGENLDYIRNSQGEVLRKIGPNWVNGLGDCQPSEGYLVKMFVAGEIIYPVEITVSSF